jgi:hypothetical protein
MTYEQHNISYGVQMCLLPITLYQEFSGGGKEWPARKTDNLTDIYESII